MSDVNFILDKHAAKQKIERMALQIAETLKGDIAPILLVGVTCSGTAIAQKVLAEIKKLLHNPIEIVTVQLNKNEPKEVTFDKAVDANGKNIIVIDDVSNSGRTLLYAVKPLLSFIPKRIQTLVVIERMHRNFPVKPDYVGMSVATPGNENIVVNIENDEVIGAYIEERLSDR